tara:strand:+ start:309 stop:2237 length:1929 start_codon:yes stop_codon:yes gene_type:complete
MTSVAATTNNIFSEQAEVILKHRYFLKDNNGEHIESGSDLFKRVAKAIAAMEKNYFILPVEVELIENDFYHMMNNLEFIPNSPTLMNAGTEQGTLSACFVLPLEDSMEGIMKAATDSAMVQKFGGGTGFSLSKIRPKGSRIKTTHGVACGPIEVLKTLSRVSSMITQGGKRDGANMAVMSVYHPDILDFISCKSVEGDIHNFNISVGVDSNFMRSVLKNEDYELINPLDDTIVGKLNAKEVFNRITEGAWKNGEPGMIFLDQVNTDNHVKKQYGQMIATNPCGEQPLLGNESCNLGSINLSKFFLSKSAKKDIEVDWVKLEKITRLATRFLDSVIDANHYATPEIEEMTKSTRKIGLGVMGFADLLIQMKIPYNSESARTVGDEIMSNIRRWSDDESLHLGIQRGTFPAWGESDYKDDEHAYRNACRLTVAPTGTISMISDCSSGIEPTFALVWKKQNILEGQTLNYVNKYFEEDANKYDFYSEELMNYLADGGSLKSSPDKFNVPEWIKEVYVTSPEISAEDHVLMQAAFQKHVDSGISKTINFPNDATINDIKKSYLLAWETKCKGITVYRAGSREKEVLVKGKNEDIENIRLASPLSDEEHSDITYMEKVEDCCENPYIIMESGCETCKSCGWSACTIA